MRMDYAIIGGDGRFAHLARLLKARGRRVGVYGREPLPDIPALDEAALAGAKNLVTNFPPKYPGNGMLFEEILATAGKEARVFACGPLHPDAADGRLVDLWRDEALILENARLTAEGAAASAMRASTGALRGARCMVIGYGRIGRALTEILVALGARVTVASRGTAGRNRAVERGAEVIPTACVTQVLPGQEIVFNTAPAKVLDEAALRRADGGAMLIDLASLPYGIDLPAAWSLGLRAWREPGLPGRYCPRSAARALLDAIERHGL